MSMVDTSLMSEWAINGGASAIAGFNIADVAAPARFGIPVEGPKLHPHSLVEG